MPFILSFVINNIVYNVKMEVKNEHLDLGGKPTSMETIYDMVEHFRRVPIYRDVVTLKNRGRAGPNNFCQTWVMCK